MNFKVALKDISDGAKNYEFWVTFGTNDIKSKYRRSKLGQWWITLSVAAFILVIGGLYRGIFNSVSTTYLAYLAVGYISWIFMQDCVNTGCLAIAQAKPFILQRSWPVSIFVFRLIYREILILIHHAVILPPIFYWLGLWPGLDGLLYAFLGFCLVAFTAFSVVLFLAIISLRFRDFPPIIASLMRMAFFATPIIWVERNLGSFGEWVTLLNPFGYFVKIVREPLLGNGFPVLEWGVAIGLSLFFSIVAFLTLAVTKNRLSYWL